MPKLRTQGEDERKSDLVDSVTVQATKLVHKGEALMCDLHDGGKGKILVCTGEEIPMAYAIKGGEIIGCYCVECLGAIEEGT